MKEFLNGCVNDNTASKLEKYYELLVETNKVMNLTAITAPDEVARLHFMDSLSVLSYSDFNDKSVIDIGTGAGFPGVVMKLACPSLRLTLLDSQQKRVDFLKTLCSELELDADCLAARAEEAALKPPLRDGFDFAVSRAVARLTMLAELCLPFVRPGGCFLAMKSAACEDERAEAEHAIALLGGELLENFYYELPGGVKRALVVIRKKSPTPKGYPRRFAKIKTSPL